MTGGKKNEQQFNWNCGELGPRSPNGRGGSIAGPLQPFTCLASLSAPLLPASCFLFSSLSPSLFLSSSCHLPHPFQLPFPPPPPSNPDCLPVPVIAGIDLSSIENSPFGPETRTEVFVQSRQASLPSTFESLCVFVCFAALPDHNFSPRFNLQQPYLLTLVHSRSIFRIRYHYTPVVKFSFSLPTGLLPKTTRAIFLLPCYTLPKWRGTFLTFYH